ncbi:MAG TPA: peroxiredoxin [Methylotenera sp.]|nr:peroxiredoxin [Methylotenera sp.]
MSSQYTSLPAGLPIPVNDGSAKHLEGMVLPDVSLDSTSGIVKLIALAGTVVIYIYPMSGRPGIPLPDGWDEIPGARGCTPQACDFSDHNEEFSALSATVFGLSSQPSDYQLELKQRLHLPFELLSDSQFALQQAMNLPVFQTSGMQLYKRLTMIVKANIIKKVFYPIFPPDQHAKEVIDWLKSH